MDAVEAEVGGLGSDLLADPCAFLAAEHGRQRALLGHLERLARHAHGAAQPAIAKALVAWLACELPMHLTDEADSLLPRLAGAAPALVVRLEAEDLALRDLRQKVRDALAPIAAGHAAPDGFAATALAFAQLYRHRLTTEEEEVLPIARRVLDATACDAIAAEMRQRRN
ncbi:hemerythrin domain-containing protein [Falsiroseomonas oryziterrae]|uniref:hemerythrin domain-containing protein n=1 Tax=Falsiroseomonas oryziterrae TaxID=2911368 RepID=UPI001F3E3F0C|nr:hemerythrin domain-containing protein [Roseomonas sp. NPKOSM-4]